MAIPNTVLIEALEDTATRLESGAAYSWSHMGRCNCGHLAQTVTRLQPRDIHRRALRGEGSWTEQSEHYTPYCPVTGNPLDGVIDRLIEVGLNTNDIQRLEHLSDPKVLKRLPGGFRHLQRNRREDLILYLRTWAECLRAQLPQTTVSPSRRRTSQPERADEPLVIGA